MNAALTTKLALIWVRLNHLLVSPAPRGLRNIRNMSYLPEPRRTLVQGLSQLPNKTSLALYNFFRKPSAMGRFDYAADCLLQKIEQKRELR